MSVASIVAPQIIEPAAREAWELPLACLLILLGYFAWAPGDSLALDVHQSRDEIAIRWNRSAIDVRGKNLEIIDGVHRAAMFVSRRLASVTHQPSTTDVEVRLGALADPARTEIALCLMREPVSAGILKGQITGTGARAAALDRFFAKDALKVASLQREAERLLAMLSPPPKATPAASTSTRWWR